MNNLIVEMARKRKPYFYIKKAGRKSKDLTGHQFGDWTVISLVGYINNSKNRYWTIKNNKTGELARMRQDKLMQFKDERPVRRTTKK